MQIGTGFKDEDLDKHSEFFKDHIIPHPRPYYRWDSAVEPDHWFEAVQVWEIKAADLSISPTHKAAMGLVRTDICVKIIQFCFVLFFFNVAELLGFC